MVNLRFFSKFLIIVFKNDFQIFQNVHLLVINNLPDWIKDLFYGLVCLFKCLDKLCLTVKILVSFLLNWLKVSFNFLCFVFECTILYLESFWNGIHLVIFMTVFENALDTNKSFLVGAKGWIKKKIPSYFFECLLQCLKLEFLSLIRARFFGILLTLSINVKVLHWTH